MQQIDNIQLGLLHFRQDGEEILSILVLVKKHHKLVMVDEPNVEGMGDQSHKAFLDEGSYDFYCFVVADYLVLVDFGVGEFFGEGLTVNLFALVVVPDTAFVEGVCAFVQLLQHFGGYLLIELALVPFVGWGHEHAKRVQSTSADSWAGLNSLHYGNSTFHLVQIHLINDDIVEDG